MKINFLEKLLGSAFFSGYIPFASGTFGSLVAVLIYLIPGFENPTIMMFMIAFFYLIGLNISSKFETVYGKDPSQCTIDEMVGTWISLLFIPKKLIFIAFAFLVWRALDILKPFPANVMEKIKGGKGIMLDDVVAGIYALIIAHIFVFFIQ